VTAIEHSAAAFAEASDGTWGILWAHAQDREATGAYRTQVIAGSRAMQTLMASGGMRYALVQRHRGPDAEGNGYRPLTPWLRRELYGEPMAGRDHDIDGDPW
jgi:hypothetical protein